MTRDYETKRDFGGTPEPRPGDGAALQEPFFVIQEHDASSHHFDVRLAVDGVLVSWAVPRGPSTDPSEKRLALRTEDHPPEYADFEGVIPEGEYGAGTVLVWDRGSYRSLKEDGEGDEAMSVARQIADGHATVWLEGEKIRGGYALIRSGGVAGDEEGWLLIKMDDEEADRRRNPTSTEPESVLTGRTLEEVAEEESPGGEEGDDGEDGREGEGNG